MSTKNFPLAQETPLYSADPAISKATKTFLTALNTSGGDPLETMTPEEARLYL